MTQTQIDQAALDGELTLHDLTTARGQPCVVTLRAIKISESQAFLAARDDEAEALRFAVSGYSAEGWEGEFDPDMLSEASYDALVEANDALNFTAATRRVAKQLKRTERTALGMQEVVRLMGSVLQRFAAQSPVPTGSAAGKSATSPSAG